jgi:enoyl-CoA hydratase/carnithine racemase
MSTFVQLEKTDGVAHVILNSPPANAMSPELMQQLDDVVKELTADRESRAVVFRSGLEKIFMAGADLKHLLSLNGEDFQRYIKEAQDILCGIEELPQPTIAVINGHALGGGCELTLCCDFRFMADTKATIGVPEVKLGLLPGAGGTQRLPRLVGRSSATEMLLRGSTLTGPNALSIGLVDKVFPPDILLSESIRLAEELSQGATRAIAKIKECLRIPTQNLLTDGLAQELEGIGYLFTQSLDTKEGIEAFSQKRPPKYIGK